MVASRLPPRPALDILVALRTCAAGSKIVLPSRYDANPACRRQLRSCGRACEGRSLPLEPFTVHDLRRTGSTLQNEVGFNCDWIKKCLAHEEGRSSRSVYNKASTQTCGATCCRSGPTIGGDGRSC